MPKKTEKNSSFTGSFYMHSLCMAFVVSFFGTLHGVIARDMGASAAQLTLLSQAAFLGGIASIFTKRLVHRLSWAKSILLLFGLSGLFLLPFAFKLSINSIISVSFVVLVLLGASNTLPNSMLKLHVESSKRQHTLKYARIFGLLLIVPLSNSAGALQDYNNQAFRVLFPLAGIFATLAGFCFLPVITPEDDKIAENMVEPENKRIILQELSVLHHDRSFLAFMLILFIGTFAEKIGMPVLPIFFRDTLNLTYKQVTQALGVVGPLMAIAGYLFWAKVANHRSPLFIICWAMLFKGLRPLLWAISAKMDNPMPLLLIGEGVFRFMISGMEMGMLLRVMQYGKNKDAAIYMGLHFAFMGIRGFLGPIVGLLLIISGMNIINIYWLITGIVFLGTFCMFLLRYFQEKPKNQLQPTLS